jgi:transposase
MEHYVGLDVSLKLTAICVVDRSGKIEREGVVTSDPETIAAFVKSHAPHVARIGLEAGATSTWLWTELNKMGLPVICIDARHAKAALKMRINKSDRNDAVGIARIMQSDGTRKSASKISTVMRSKPCLSAELCLSRSSV